jgi:hypothetical protein
MASAPAAKSLSFTLAGSIVRALSPEIQNLQGYTNAPTVHQAECESRCEERENGMKWKSAILTLLLLSTPRSPVEAAPDYNLEALLRRAEIVYVGRVSELSLEKQPAMLSTGEGGSHISDRKIQLEIVEVLRGNKGDIKGNYGLLGLGDRPVMPILFRLTDGPRKDAMNRTG